MSARRANLPWQVAEKLGVVGGVSENADFLISNTFVRKSESILRRAVSQLSLPFYEDYSSPLDLVREKHDCSLGPAWLRLLFRDERKEDWGLRARLKTQLTVRCSHHASTDAMLENLPQIALLATP